MLELNIILSLTKCEVCVLQNCHVCGWLAVLHAPSKKVWPPLINPLPHPVFSLFTVWLNRVGPLPHHVFTVYSHYAYVTVVFAKRMSVSKNRKQFAGSEKPNPTWEGE